MIIQECEKEYDNVEERRLAWEMIELKIRFFLFLSVLKRKEKV